jgi:hypothetical protein
MIAKLIFAASIAAAALSAPAFARGGPEDTVVTGDDNARVIILTDRHHGPAEGAPADGRRIRVYGLNGDGEIACGADHRVIERSSPDGHEHSKVVLCGHTELSAEERSARLEHVLERIQHMDGLSDSSKERVTAALRGAIEELRSSR